MPKEAIDVSFPKADKDTTIFNASQSSVVEESSPVLEMNSTSSTESNSTTKCSSANGMCSSNNTVNATDSENRSPDIQDMLQALWNSERKEGIPQGVKPGRNKRRRKRHVGPHDEGGLQRLISTGKIRIRRNNIYR